MRMILPWRSLASKFSMTTSKWSKWVWEKRLYWRPNRVWLPSKMLSQSRMILECGLCHAMSHRCTLPKYTIIMILKLNRSSVVLDQNVGPVARAALSKRESAASNVRCPTTLQMASRLSPITLTRHWTRGLDTVVYPKWPKKSTQAARITPWVGVFHRSHQSRIDPKASKSQRRTKISNNPSQRELHLKDRESHFLLRRTTSKTTWKVTTRPGQMRCPTASTTKIQCPCMTRKENRWGILALWQSNRDWTRSSSTSAKSTTKPTHRSIATLADSKLQKSASGLKADSSQKSRHLRFLDWHRISCWTMCGFRNFWHNMHPSRCRSTP